MTPLNANATLSPGNQGRERHHENYANTYLNTCYAGSPTSSNSTGGPLAQTAWKLALSACTRQVKRCY